MGIKKIICGLFAGFVLALSILPTVVSAEDKRLPSGIAYSAIEQMITDYINEHKRTTASVALAIFEGQDTLYEANYGYANIDNQTLVNDETVYEWGSATKLLVWVSVMQLYEQGKLDLDEDVRSYLPNGFLTKLSYSTPITMLNLMNHTGGWQETTYDIESENAVDIVNLEQALRQSEPSQIFKPGTVCAYSNWGCALAGYIVERISRQPFYEYVQKNIFAPLGMEHTALAPDLSDNTWVQKQRSKLNCYYIDNESFEDLGTSIRHILLYPAGMATGTLDDFMTFAKAFLPDKNEKCKLFKNTDTLNTMLSPTLFYGDTDIPRVSHGMWTMQFSVTTIGHAGNTRGSTTNLLIDTASRVGIVVMTNQCGEMVYTNNLMSLIFGEFKAKQKGEVLPSTENISGIYTSARTIKMGMFRIYNVIGSLLSLSKTGDENTLAVSIGKGSLTQVAPYQYVFDMGGARFFMYADVHGNNVSLQMMSQDYIKENPVVFFTKVGLILIGLVGVAYSVVALITELISLIIRKMRTKAAIPLTMKKYRIITQLSEVLLAVIFASMLNSDVITPGTMWWKCILNGIFAIALIGYTIVLMLKYKKLECSKWQKFNYVITAVTGLILTGNVLYWQVFNFWTY